MQEDQEVHSHLAEDDQYFAVELARGQRGFGFSIRGGREFHSMPLFVLRMAVDGESRFFMLTFLTPPPQVRRRRTGGCRSATS